MSFRHTRDGTIRINEVNYSPEDIRAVVPNYTLPAGMSHAEIDNNPRVFDEGGNQYRSPDDYTAMVVGVLDALPEIIASRKDRELAEEKKRKEDEQEKQDALPLGVRKRIFYDEQGITTDRFVLALMQREFDGDDSEMLEVEKGRNEARARDDFPGKGEIFKRGWGK